MAFARRETVWVSREGRWLWAAVCAVGLVCPPEPVPPPTALKRRKPWRPVQLSASLRMRSSTRSTILQGKEESEKLCCEMK